MRKSERKVERSFHFGESEYKALRELEIPCDMGGERIYIRTIIVQGDIPWLIGRETMARMKMEIGIHDKIVKLGAMKGMKVIIK